MREKCSQSKFNVSGRPEWFSVGRTLTNLHCAVLEPIPATGDAVQSPTSSPLPSHCKNMVLSTCYGGGIEAGSLMALD